MPIYSKSINVSATIEDNLKTLRHALLFGGPYVLCENDIECEVTREEFLDFCVNIAVEDLEELLELVGVT